MNQIENDKVGELPYEIVHWREDRVRFATMLGNMTNEIEKVTGKEVESMSFSYRKPFTGNFGSDGYDDSVSVRFFARSSSSKS